MPQRPPLRLLEGEALKEGPLPQVVAYLKAALAEDSRPGARNLLRKYERRLSSEKNEQDRLEALWVYEKKAQTQGASRIAGVDEAGRGPLAGPVVACAVILPPGFKPRGLNDSKQLTPEKRKSLSQEIKSRALSLGVGRASTQEIDEINIYQAARLAMERAIEALALKPDYLLTDAMPLPKLREIPQTPLVHGDALSASIAAASIVAKVTRDEWMMELHGRFPQYGFQSHKGYGTEEHLRALEEHGPCPEHRVTFGPVTEVLARRSLGGPGAFWGEKINQAGGLDELQRVGVQIKRLASEKLSSLELERLRKLYRDKQAQWQGKIL